MREVTAIRGMGLVVVGAAVAALLTRAAHADAPGAVPAGESSDARPLATDDRGRQAVRGCLVANACRQLSNPGVIELELAGSGSSAPWISTQPVSGSGRPSAKAGTDPLVLRPDLPWLGELAKPDLPFAWHPRVIDFLEHYRTDPRGREIMAAWLRDQGKYADLIVNALGAAGLPEDLLYVAMIESSYDPRTTSYAGAAGLWQFMPDGGRIYGLRLDFWVDERRDPERATAAAVLYFADLEQRFANWELALAAYNAGYGAVLGAMAKYNSNDFWRLIRYENALPWQTTFYVPKVLAAAVVGRNRAAFGYDHIEPATAVRTARVTVPGSVPLEAVARAAGVGEEIIAELNPALRRSRTPPDRDGYSVRIPAASADLFAARFPEVGSDWDQLETYTVAHGERFQDIATAHGLSRRALRRLNDVDHESEVSGGTVLIVPRLGEEERHRNRRQARDDLYSGPGRLGDKLVVAIPRADLEVDGKQRVFYRVASGDTLWKIARSLAVSVADLTEWNDLNPEAFLYAGMVLRAFVDPSWSSGKSGVALLDETRLILVEPGSVEHLEESERQRGRKRFRYRAKKRESFAQIGARFGLSAHDVARINQQPPDTVLRPGDEIVLYRVVDPNGSRRAAEQARNRGRQRSKQKPRRRRSR